MNVFDLGGPRVSRDEPVVGRNDGDAAFGEVGGVPVVEAVAVQTEPAAVDGEDRRNGPSPAGMCTSSI